MENDGGKRKVDRRVYLAIGFVCLGVAVGAAVYLIVYLVSLNRGNQGFEDLREVADQTVESVPPEESSGPEEAASTEPEEAADPDENMNRVINFAAVQKENADIYAWIYIPDTNVDYPVLQHPTDDSYYLNYNLDGTKGYPGCIYTERVNAKDFMDFNTLIYGHNMKNGSMFHDLHQYADLSFLEEHPYVYLYLPDKTLKYQVFAAYRYDDRHIMYSFDFASEAVRNGYLEGIFNIRELNSAIRKDVTVTADDHVITLSTCVTGTDYRFLVQAVLMD
ncbi:MAG: class B sortase [Clostridium sp.]|jgi:sortase B|nr:class B sortase [Clostridium sp.]